MVASVKIAAEGAKLLVRPSSQVGTVHRISMVTDGDDYGS
jgi:hypothetical protein